MCYSNLQLNNCVRCITLHSQINFFPSIILYSLKCSFSNQMTILSKIKQLLFRKFTM